MCARRSQDTEWIVGQFAPRHTQKTLTAQIPCKDNMKATESRGDSRIRVLLGPTGGGKTLLSLLMARKAALEVVSVDSMQVYRGMDTGTAKAPADVRAKVPHHMIDVVEPEESFNAARFCRMACVAVSDIQRRGKVPLLVCGTPFYLQALLWGMFDGPDAQADIRERLRMEAAREGVGFLHGRLKAVDPEAAARIDAGDYKRIERALEVYEVTGRPISEQQDGFTGAPRLDAVIAGIVWPRQVLYDRINRRVEEMMELGLLDEVRAIRYRLGPQARQAVGYKELIAYLDGRLDLESALELIKRNTRRFARDQVGWFKKFPAVRWIDMGASGSMEAAADECMDALCI